MRINKSDAEWRRILTPLQFNVLRQKGTEPPHTGIYNQHFEKGVYKCAGCGLNLFDSSSKFKCSCGWPAFDRPISNDAVKEEPDSSHGMKRIEVLCADCGGHLGHVFEDGPTLTGLRYCINSASLQFSSV